MPPDQRGAAGRRDELEEETRRAAGTVRRLPDGRIEHRRPSRPGASVPELLDCTAEARRELEAARAQGEPETPAQTLDRLRGGR